MAKKEEEKLEQRFKVTSLLMHVLESKSDSFKEKIELVEDYERAIKRDMRRVDDDSPDVSSIDTSLLNML